MFPNCFKLDKGELCLFRLSLSVEGSFFWSLILLQCVNFVYSPVFPDTSTSPKRFPQARKL